MAEGNEAKKIFDALCLKLSRGIAKDKLKQLKFLLQDLVRNDVLKNKTFLEIITELESQAILNRSCPTPDGALLLCDLFEAISLKHLANTICKELRIEKDPGYKSRITAHRKLLVTLSENLNHYLEQMLEFLENSGHNILHGYSPEDSLDTLQVICRAGLSSPDDLSLLKKMVESFRREDLLKLITDFEKNPRGGKAVFGLRNLPSDVIEREPELNAVLEKLKSGKNKVGVVGVRKSDVIGIRGMGGIGKTVLAQAVAWRASLSREVIWLDVGQTPDCLALINRLVSALGGRRSFSDLPAAQSWIRENTEHRDCLVVLDDVWSVDDASVFDYLAGDCQLLVTTRDAEVVRGLKGSDIHELGIMGKDEARRLLYHSAQIQPAEVLKIGKHISRIVEGLLEECRGLPLALALVGSSLVETRVEQDWQDVLHDLKNADLESLRSYFPKDAYPYDNLLAAIGVSFQRLEKDHQEKFLDFSIFPEDTNIPWTIIETFWSSRVSSGSSCSGREARRILNVLEKRSLVQKGSQQSGEQSYRVHDLLLDFARGKLRRGVQSIKDVQARFLDIFRGKCVNGAWSKLPDDNEYLFTYLPFHLCSAAKLEDLFNLFFDFQWLERKVKVTSLASLISDFRFLEAASEEVKLLKSSLMLSADVLDNRPSELGGQLLGRLISTSEEYSHLKKLLKDIQQFSSQKCALMPLHSCLTEPSGPLIKIFSKHRLSVMSLATAYRVKGTIVISASSDQLIKVHELETGTEVKVLKGHKMAVYCLALSHGGTILASGSYDTTVRIWNLDSYEEMRVLEGGGGYVNALVFSPDDERLFSGSNDGKLRVWFVSTGELVHSVSAHEGHIRGLCTVRIPNGLLVATASYDHTVKLWNADTWNLEKTLNGHTEAIYAVTSTSDSRILVTASGDKTLKIWDLKMFQELHSLCGHENEIYSVAITPDDERVLSGGGDVVVRLWCLATGQLLLCFRGHSQSVRFVMVSADGTKALSASQDTTFRVWDISKSDLKQGDFLGHTQDVMEISVDDKGSICASCSTDGTVKIWRCEAFQELVTLRGHTRRAVSVALSHDGAYVASLAKDSFVKVWDWKRGKLLASVEMPDPRLVRFSNTDELVLIGCENNELWIWEWRNEEASPRSVVLPAFTTMEMAMTEENIYTCSSGAELCKIDLKNNNASKLCRGPHAGYTSTVILPDGKAVVCGIPTGNSFILWELSTRREISYNTGYPLDALVTAIDITKNGDQVLSGSSHGNLSLVQLTSSEIVQRYSNTRAGKCIRFVAVLNDGRHFVFVDETKTVELRSLNDAEKLVLGELESHVTSICSIGQQLVLVGCESGEIVLFSKTQLCGRHQCHNAAVARLASRTRDDFLFFISAGTDGSVKLSYLANTAPPVWIKLWYHERVHDFPVTALAFVPGSEDVVSGSYDNEVKRICKTGIVQKYVFKCFHIVALRVVGDSLLATFVRSFSVVKWSLKEGALLRRVHGGAGREQVARIFLPHGQVVSKDSHHSLVCWDLNSSRTVRKLQGHTHDIRTLVFVPGGTFLMSGSRDKVLKLWDLQRGELVDEFHFERYVTAITCASNGVACVGLQGGQVCFMRITNMTKPNV